MTTTNELPPQKANTLGTEAPSVQPMPAWARRISELYASGTTALFVLHGDTFDLVPTPEPGGGTGFRVLNEFLAEQLFGRWDLVLHYDLARGLRCMAGRDEARLREMVAAANRKIGDLSALPRDLGATLALLDRFVEKTILADKGERLSAALVISHASFVAPRGGHGGERAARQLVTLLNWATSPYIKRVNLAFVLVEPQLALVSERLTANPHVATVELPLPGEATRLAYLGELIGARDPASFSDYTPAQIAALTAGISLTDLGVLIRSSLESGQRLDAERFTALKKTLIERQAHGLLEFVEPRWGLDMVVGHEAAKARLRDDAALLARGALDSVPMGYLVCGPVGTGKSFLAQCAAGAIGIPAVKLKNFRSKFVGETEANLERVLSVLRSMGPVVVIVDEADAMLGDRDQGGDSGIGGRVFGMIAQQMGDTRYRGKILWMLLTARPDLLPIDLKRQGRAEVHMPLFYPTDQEELRRLFVVMAKKSGAHLAEGAVGQIPHQGQLSGADIEGVIGRAWRRALLAGGEEISAEQLAEALAGFIPSADSLERELQRLAAIIECTDREFLPPAISAEIERRGGRGKIAERLSAIKSLLGD